jgi:predicted MPP superfamily phosphohydrolase
VWWDPTPGFFTAKAWEEFGRSTPPVQIQLPFYGALVTLSKFGKKYEAGMYTVNETILYVNRGIGMEGGLAPRVRFLARPEITVFDIIPKEQSSP